jgi:hypothetical protein
LATFAGDEQQDAVPATTEDAVSAAAAPVGAEAAPIKEYEASLPPGPTLPDVPEQTPSDEEA